MKSILAKQAPQRSPWLPIGARQEIQTGGSRRSAKRPTIGRMMAAAPRALAGGASRSSSVPPIAMDAMIEPERLKLKARSHAIP